MKARDLTQAHIGKMVSTVDRSGFLRCLGRRARLPDLLYITMHIEAFDGTSVLFVQADSEVLVEA